jgi:hypothetical protein
LYRMSDIRDDVAPQVGRRRVAMKKHHRVDYWALRYLRRPFVGQSLKSAEISAVT